MLARRFTMLLSILRLIGGVWGLFWRCLTATCKVVRRAEELSAVSSRPPVFNGDGSGSAQG